MSSLSHNPSHLIGHDDWPSLSNHGTTKPSTLVTTASSAAIVAGQTTRSASRFKSLIGDLHIRNSSHTDDDSDVIGGGGLEIYRSVVVVTWSFNHDSCMSFCTIDFSDNGNNNRLWNKRLAASLQHLAASLQQIRGCLGTTWKKQLDLLKMDIISKTTMKQIKTKVCTDFKAQNQTGSKHMTGLKKSRSDGLKKTVVYHCRLPYKNKGCTYGTHASNTCNLECNMRFKDWKESPTRMLRPFCQKPTSRPRGKTSFRQAQFCLLCWKHAQVLKWDAFSFIVAEKDIPNLKSILTFHIGKNLRSYNEKYKELQYGVKKVQRHFVLNVKPLKYDLFHMTLHSIWYNRTFQIKPR
ncbi:probable glycosyltransferase [Tanacetum coccineum]